MRYGAVSAGSNGDGDEFDRLTYVRDDGDVESMASSSTSASTGYPRTGKRHNGTLSSGTDSSTAHSRGWTLPWSSVAALALLALVGASVGLAGLHMDPDAGTSSSISSLVTGGAATASVVAKGPVKPTPPLPASPSSTENAPASSDVAPDAAAEDTETDATAAATTAEAAATTSADDAQASAKAAAASTITDVNAAVEVSSPDYGVSQALKHLPWDAVAEAYRDQTIRLLMTYKTSASDEEAVAASEDDVVVKWQILGKKYSGLEATFNAAAIPGVYECTVSVSAAADGTELYSKTFNMAVKYIRREVRSLTEADRTKFFSALKLFYATEEDAGKKLYGDKFNNAKYFLLKHLNGAGRSDCDHWHDGPAFINKHLAFTLEAEQSLQVRVVVFCARPPLGSTSLYTSTHATIHLVCCASGHRQDDFDAVLGVLLRRVPAHVAAVGRVRPRVVRRGQPDERRPRAGRGLGRLRGTSWAGERSLIALPRVLTLLSHLAPSYNRSNRCRTGRRLCPRGASPRRGR
jgi:hypothetical protein